MSHHKVLSLSLVFVAAASAPAAIAQDALDRLPPPAAFKALTDCRTITESAQRLACYDQRTDALAQAQQSGDLVVADREQIREERRGLFGLSLPRIKIFGGDEDDEVKSFNGVIKSVGNASGGLRLELQEGAVWQQTDGHFVGTPAVGDPITISRAALGSYMAKLKNGSGIRVKRVR